MKNYRLYSGKFYEAIQISQTIHVHFQCESFTMENFYGATQARKESELGEANLV